jgi:uncharacterized damage-inducible protein DinB
MAAYSRSLFLQCLDEWMRFPEAFRRLSPDQQASFLQQQGFASLRDLLAHIAAWWEEANGIIHERLAGRPRPPRKYDLDAFNADSLARFKDTSEAELLVWYESQRERIAGTVSELTDEWLKIRTIYAWLDGVILEHLKEHGLDAPRFLVIDTLQREWNDCLPLFNGLAPEQKQAFLERQGYPRFRDLIAHIVAWWEDGIRLIGRGGDEDPCEVQDVDAFNAAAVARFGKLQEAEVFAGFERTRLVLMNLVGTLPDEILLKPNVQSWLRADVIDHYFEHRY